MGKNPLMDRLSTLRQSDTAQRVSEGIQDVREKLDESEFVGRVKDFRQRFGEGNEAAVTYKEIRMRHPSFDMPTFLHAIRQEVPIIIKVRLSPLRQAISKDWIAPVARHAQTVILARLCLRHIAS